MEKATLKVPAISCGHCVMTIKKALGKLAGVTNVDADIARKTVTVSYDPSKVSLASIGEALAAAGYPVAD